MSSCVQSNRRLLGWVSFLAVSGILGSAAFADEKKPDNKENKRSEQMTCPMMAGLSDLTIHADSADALLARAKELQLEESQIEHLTDIQQRARKQALKVLTAKQRESLGEVSQLPVSIAQLAQAGLKQKEQNGDASEKRMCPWCVKSMNREAEAEKERGSRKESGNAEAKSSPGGKEEKKEACDCPCCAKKEKSDMSKQSKSQDDQQSKEDCSCDKEKTTELRVNKGEDEAEDEDEAEPSDAAGATSDPKTE